MPKSTLPKAALLLTLAVAAMPGGALLAQNEAVPEIARIVAANPGGTVHHVAFEDLVEEAYPGAVLYAGDTVATGPESWIELETTGGARLVVEESSELALGYRAYHVTAPETDRFHRLLRGALQVRREDREGRPERVESGAVTVNLAVAGDYRIEKMDDGAVEVAALSGWAEVAGERGSVFLDEGHTTLVSAEGAPRDPVAMTAEVRDRFARRAGPPASVRVEAAVPEPEVEVVREMPEYLEPRRETAPAPRRPNTFPVRPRTYYEDERRAAPRREARTPRREAPPRRETYRPPVRRYRRPPPPPCCPWCGYPGSYRVWVEPYR